MKRKINTRQIALCAIIAALYTAITLASAPLAYGLIQFRLADALIVLCCFEPILGVGVTLGCFLANLFSTVTALDMVIGTAATAIACLLTVKIKNPWLVPLPNILANGLLVGAMLAWVLFPGELLLGFVTAFLQVAFGELVVMYLLGVPLLLALRKAPWLQKFRSTLRA